MGNIYDIDYSQQAPEIMPPDKRDPQTNAVVIALSSVVQWCRDLLFGSYKTGATCPAYSPGTYAKYDQVIFEKAVYYSLVSGNSDAPTVTASWLKVQDNFLGVDQRVRFNGQNLVLEFALNQRFGGTFRPPGSTSLSDIYLTNIAPVIAGFLIGQDDGYSSTVGQTTSSDTIGFPYPFVQIHNFQVNILAAVFSTTNEQAIRDFINLYIPSSLNFIIATY